MYFLSLEVENIRCFGEKQILDLSDGAGKPAQWTLLLGDNGIGKTTLLQCLTWMRTVEAPMDDIKRTKKGVMVKPIMDDLEENTEMEVLIRTGDNMKSIIKGTYSLNTGFSENHSSSKKKDDTIQVGMILEAKQGQLTNVLPILDDLKSFNSPNLFAYSASRHMATRNLEQSELRDPVANFRSESADLYDAEQVLLSLDHSSRIDPKGNSGPLLLKVKQLLADLLPDIDDAEKIKILGPKVFTEDQAPSGVQIIMPSGAVTLDALSLGYKTMLAWAVDLALRLFRANPKSVAPLSESAIVIIDEIDLHLHPKWQRQVKTFLCKHFPNVQFICTAHSPFMAQAAENANLVALKREGNHVVIDNNPLIVEGWRIDQIATSDLIGVPSARSVQVEVILEERRVILLKKRKSANDKKRIAELDKIISNLPTEEDSDNQRTMDLIKKAVDLMGKKKL